MNKCICNFCGGSDREVAKMIVNKNGNICDECVQQCVCILLDESRENSLKAKRDREKINTAPAPIKPRLKMDRVVVVNSETKPETL